MENREPSEQEFLPENLWHDYMQRNIEREGGTNERHILSERIRQMSIDILKYKYPYLIPAEAVDELTRYIRQLDSTMCWVPYQTNRVSKWTKIYSFNESYEN